MNKTTTLLILFVALLKINFYGQGFIKGAVTAKNTGEMLPGALIVTDSKTGTSSDINGLFILNSAAGEHFIECSLLGFRTLKQKVNVINNDTLRLNFVLEDGNTVLDEVVVSAGKFEQKLSDVTVSMDVIKPSLIENKNSTSLDLIMNQVPGVTITDGQASIRGGSGFAYGAGSRVLMLVDEMPMISADAGDVKWNYLPLENLSQVEVIKGASSALFGSSALNGVINLRTAYAKDKPITSASSFYGIYDAPRYQYKWWKGSSQTQRGLNFSHAEKIGNFDLVLGGHMFNDEGYRYLETENRGRFNANIRYNFKKVKGLSVGVNTNMMEVKGGLFFIWHNADTAYLPSGQITDTVTHLPPANSVQNYKNGRFNVDPFVTYYFGDGNKLSYRYRYYATNNTNDKNQEARAELNYGELQYQKRFKKDLTLTTGFVHMLQQIYSLAVYGRHTGKNYAGYLQADKKFKKLTLSVGLRGEYYRVDTAYTRGYINDNIKNLPFQPVVRAGANYQLFEYTFLRSSFGQGYRFPSVAEKFVNTNVSSLTIFPNTALQPERGWSAEFGIKQGFKISKFKGFFDVAAFWTEYTNMIEFVFDYYHPKDTALSGFFVNDLKYAGFKSQNSSKAQIKGVELSLTGTGKMGPVNVTLFTGYTYIDPIKPDYNPLTDTLGLPGLNVLKYRSRHVFKNDVQLDYKKLTFGFSTRYQSFMENIDRRFTQSILHEYNTPTFSFDDYDAFYILPGVNKYRQKFNKGYWVHDLRVGIQLSKIVRISYICNNFTNVEWSTRPGDVRPPRMNIFQLMVKI